jgi:hypothetical protein
MLDPGIISVTPIFHASSTVKALCDIASTCEECVRRGKLMCVLTLDDGATYVTEVKAVVTYDNTSGISTM